MRRVLEIGSDIRSRRPLKGLVTMCVRAERAGTGIFVGLTSSQASQARGFGWWALRGHVFVQSKENNHTVVLALTSG